MDEIEQLIETISTSDDLKSEEVVKHLVAIGIPAVPAVIDAIRARSEVATWKLCKVLLQIRHPNIVPVMIKLIHEQNRDLALTAFQNLKLSKDLRALQPLCEYLLDSENPETRRSLAAEALGELKEPKVIGVLLKVANSILSEPDIAPAIKRLPLPIDAEIDESLLRIVLSIVTALPKLGNHKMTSIAISLIYYHNSDVYSDDEIIRTQAAKGLQYTVGPGVFTAIHEALGDAYYEVRLNAVDAMFYLGVKESISELILRIDDENSIVSNRALVRLRDLTGIKFNDDIQVKELQEWWKQNHKKYNTGICYRLGKPIWLPNFFALLEKPLWRAHIIQELQIITGLDFGFNRYIPEEVQNNLLNQVKMWWEEECNQFEVGCLYKYGHKQNIHSIYN